MTFPARLILLLLVCAVPGLGAAAWALAQERERPGEFLVAAGQLPRDAGPRAYLWVVQEDRESEEEEFRILFRTTRTPAGTLHPAMEARGVATAAAAQRRSLFLVYRDRTVQEVRHREGEGPQPETFAIRQLPPLPREGRLLAFEASFDRPVALIVIDPEDRQALEDPAPPPPPAEGAQAPQDPAGAEPPEEPPGPELRLLHLDRARWRPIEPPDGLDPLRVRDLAVVDPARHILALLSDGEEPGALDVHRFDGESWSRSTYPADAQPGAQAVGMGQNLFLVEPEDEAERLRVWMLRGPAPRPAGVFKLDPAAVGWRAVAWGDQIAVVFADAEGRLAWSRGDTAPTDTPPPVDPLDVTDRPGPAQDPMMVLLVAAIFIAMMLLLAAGRRDPKTSPPRLPKGLRPAASHRIAAALVDFVPGAVLAMVVFRVEPAQLFAHWPLLDRGDWQDTIPAAVAIGIHVLHTTVSELFGGGTLGKLLLGCRVTNLTGDRPGAGQVLLRGLFKALELAFPFLLLMPLVSPHYQRLGDLVARTLVVRKEVEGAPRGED